MYQRHPEGQPDEIAAMTSKDRLYTLSASAAQSLISSNKLTVEQYVSALLQRHRSRDQDVRAWACIYPDKVLQQARELDQVKPADRGRLHGFVIGVKDIINTKGETAPYGTES